MVLLIRIRNSTMRKSLSLVLAAAMTLGSITTTAAPLAKKLAGTKNDAPVAAKAMSETPRVNFAKGRTLPSAKISGLKQVKSTLKARNKQALKSATSASNAVSSSVNLKGFTIYSDAWTESAEYGLYTIPTTQGGAFDMVVPTTFSASSGYVDGNCMYVFEEINYYNILVYYYMHKLDVETGETLSTTELDDNSLFAFDLGVDPTTGKVYGTTYEGQTVYWAEFDYANLTCNRIAEVSEQLMAVGADQNGQFYGVGASGMFYKVDKSTGAYTAVGQSGMVSEFMVGGCYNDQDNTFLMTVSPEDETGLLAEINVTTGVGTVLCNFPNNEEVNCLYIAKPAATDKAPAAPELSVACDNGSMDVTVTLTMPSTLFDGTPVSGDSFAYTVLANGETVLTGSAVAGSTVTETVTLTTSGMTEFVATAANGVGTSPKAKVSCYVGKGTPAAPANVNFAWADGTATLTWSAVTTSADGGYINSAEVTYTVLDKDGNVVGDNLTATTFTTSLPTPSVYTLYSFSVKANYDGKSSTSAASNTLPLGVLAAPLTMDMSELANFNLHTVLDANNDGKTWKYDNTMGAKYTYHSSNVANDWIFSPGIKLDGGKTYEFTTKVKAQSNNYPEKIEIYMGTAATAEGMTKQVVAVTTVTADPANLTGYLTPETDGTYFIGFHAVSEPNMYNLYVQSYEIDAPLAGTMPKAVENLTVTPDANGDLKVAIACKAPVNTIDGAALTGNVKLTVTRGEDLVKEVSVAPGSSMSIEDTDVPEMGTYTYTVTATNAAGETGLPASATVYVGPTEPATPVNFNVTADGNVLTFTWDAVTTDINGNTIPETNVTYNIWSVDGGYLGEILNDEPITGNSYQMTIVLPETQDFVQYGLQAVNNGLEGGATATNIILGPAYDMPVLYSGLESLDQYLLIYGGGELELGTSDLGVDPYAGDDYFALKGAGLDAKTTFMTGLINITGDTPVVTFYSYKIADNDTNLITVEAVVDGETTLLATLDRADIEAGVWTKHKVSLEAVKGKTAQIYISGIVKAYYYVLIDEVKICNDVDYDVALEIAAPAQVATGQEFNVNVLVSNEGAKATEALTINLYRDGNLVDTFASEFGLEVNESGVVPFKQTLGLGDDSAEFKAVLVYADDQNPDNNETATVTVTRKKSTLPGVTGLTGEATENGNVLSWDAIDLGAPAPVEVTEDFESADSFAQEFEGWQFVDVDGAMVGGFQGKDIPGIVPGETTGCFFVFDASDDTFNQTFNANSGDKYLASLFNYDSSTVDDWAISPELPGIAQTISFYAKSYSTSYPDKLEVWYSTTDSDIESFVKVTEFGSVVPGGNWTLYTADLPAGAKYFALRSCATDAFMLMIDDVTFTKLSGFDGELKGYNLYCDGVKVNDAPITETSYVHTPEAGSHVYNVTAVYDKGESEYSDPVTLEQTGIDVVLAAGLKIAVEAQNIVVTGAADNLVTINTVDGKTIYAATGDAKVAVAPAIYLVTVNNKTAKVVVK